MGSTPNFSNSYSDTDPNAPKDPNAAYYYGGYQGGAQDNVNRDRNMASAATGRAAYQPDMTQSNESRGFQTNAVNAFQGAADGTAPSVAGIQAQQSTDAAIRGGQSIAASVKGGPGARLAAARAGQYQAATTAATGAQTAAMARAKEMADARTGLAQAASAERTGDLGASGQALQSNLTQRGLNQQDEQFYEGNANKVNEDQLAANAAQRKQESDNAIAERQNKLTDEKQSWDKTQGIIGDVSGAASGVLSGLGSLFSDERVKSDIAPVKLDGLDSLGLGGDSGGGTSFFGGGDISGLMKGGGQGDFTPQTKANRPPSVGGSIDMGGSGGFDSADVKQASTGLNNMTGNMVGGGGIVGGGTGSLHMVGTEGPQGPSSGPSRMVSDERAKDLLHPGMSNGGKVDAEKYVSNQRKSGAYADTSADPRGAGANDSFFGGVQKSIDGEPSKYGVFDYEGGLDAPDERSKGVAGAPKGYAEGKLKLAEDDSVGWKDPSKFKHQADGASEDKNAGVGQADWNRYGASAAKEGDPDWAHGGATKKAGDEKPGLFASLKAAMSGLSTAATGKRDTTTSDERAKEIVAKQAFEDGMKHANGQWRGNADGSKLPDYAVDDKTKSYLAAHPQSTDTRKATASPAMNQSLADDKTRELEYMYGPTGVAQGPHERHMISFENTRADQGKAIPPQIASQADAIQSADTRQATTSDERAKDIVHGLMFGPASVVESKAIERAMSDSPREPHTAASDRVGGDASRRGRDFDDGSPERQAEWADEMRKNRQSYTDENKRLEAMKKTATGPQAKADPMRDADRMIERFDIDRIKGPAVRDSSTSDKRAKSNEQSETDAAMAGANRSMDPKEYFYKPDFTPPGQSPHEVNVGPIAQNMAKDPVARTAIVKDPGTDMLAIDKEKGLKLVMGGLASLQDQVDSLEKRKSA